MTKTNSQPDKINLVLNREEKRIATLKIQAERDKRFKLVAKIISWESGAEGSIAVTTQNKVTDAEWSEYKKYIQTITTSDSVEKVKQKIDLTFENIKKNGGFA